MKGGQALPGRRPSGAAGAGVVPFNPGSDMAGITRHVIKNGTTNLIGDHLCIPGAGVAGRDLRGDGGAGTCNHVVACRGLLISAALNREHDRRISARR